MESGGSGSQQREDGKEKAKMPRGTWSQDAASALDWPFYPCAPPQPQLGILIGPQFLLL